MTPQGLQINFSKTRYACSRAEVKGPPPGAVLASGGYVLHCYTIPHTLSGNTQMWSCVKLRHFCVSRWDFQQLFARMRNISSSAKLVMPDVWLPCSSCHAKFGLVELLRVSRSSSRSAPSVRCSCQMRSDLASWESGNCWMRLGWAFSSLSTSRALSASLLQQNIGHMSKSCQPATTSQYVRTFSAVINI